MDRALVFAVILLGACGDGSPSPGARAIAARTACSPDVLDALDRLVEHSRSLKADAELIARSGDDAAQSEASRRLAVLGTRIASPEWRRDQGPTLRQADAAAGLLPTEEQLAWQADLYQDEEVLRILSAMDVIGGDLVVDFALDQAAMLRARPKRRAAAVALVRRRLGSLDEARAERCARLGAEVDVLPAVDPKRP